MAAGNDNRQDRIDESFEDVLDDDVGELSFVSGFQRWKEGHPNFDDVVREGWRTTLEAYKHSGIVEGVRIVSARDEETCPACEAMDGRTFTVGEALLVEPLPVDTCTHRARESGTRRGWCRCVYRPLFDDEPSPTAAYDQRLSEVASPGRILKLLGAAFCVGSPIVFLYAITSPDARGWLLGFASACLVVGLGLFFAGRISEREV